MKKIIFLALVLMSANSLFADIEFPKDTLWRKYIPFPQEVYGIKFSRDETKILVNSKDSVLILDTKTGQTLETIYNIGNIASESSDGSSFMNYQLEKFDSKTKQSIWKFPLRDTANFKMLTFGFSDNGKYLVVAYYRRNSKADNDTTNVDIYDVDSQEKIKSLNNSSVYYNVAISNNCEYLLYSSSVKKGNDNYDNSILYHIPTGKNIKQIYERKNGSGNTWVENLQFNQISSMNNYAIAKWKDYITVLNINSLESFLYTPSGGGYTDSRVGAISPDEKLLISSGVKNGSLELFDLELKKIIYIGARIMEFDGSAFGAINMKNTLLVLFSGHGIFMIDLQKTWTNVSNENNFKISLSPNPTNGKLRITNPNNLPILNVIAYSINGFASPLQIFNNEINISNLSNGKYFLKMTLMNNTVLNFNFIKE